MCDRGWGVVGGGVDKLLTKPPNLSVLVQVSAAPWWGGSDLGTTPGKCEASCWGALEALDPGLTRFGNESKPCLP